jgi:hypothetical protein
MDMHLTGICLIGVYIMGMYVIGMHFIGGYFISIHVLVSYRRESRHDDPISCQVVYPDPSRMKSKPNQVGWFALGRDVDKLLTAYYPPSNASIQPRLHHIRSVVRSAVGIAVYPPATSCLTRDVRPRAAGTLAYKI